MSRELKNSESFIKSNIKNNHGFSVPNDFFDNLEDTVMANITEQKFNQENAFSVPANYFENFEDELFSKIIPTKKHVKIISLKERLLKIIPTTAAACILLFIGLNYFNTSESYNFDSISTDELDSWIENYVESSNNSSIELVDEDFKNSNILEEEETNLNDEDILEYFNTIDNTSLLTEIES